MVNVDMLKITDNIKWDWELCYQQSMHVFKNLGEENEDYKKVCKILEERLNQIQQNVLTLVQNLPK